MMYKIQCSKCCSTCLQTKPGFNKHLVLGDDIEIMPEFKELKHNGLRCPICDWPLVDAKGMIRRLDPVVSSRPVRKEPHGANFVNGAIMSWFVKKTFSTNELAAAANISKFKIHRMRDQIPGASKKGRSWVYTQESVDFLKR